DDVSQNFPNPFTGKTFINVNVRLASTVSLEVTNILGKVVFTTPEKEVQPGTLRLEIDAAGFAPGVYFYSIKAGETVVTKKMIVE
ncbi:MAG: T9SS type A sorting domain-containing protein, partial [Bacteroidales bacterium]|nr:T9SS type A sorting domain-containing protein [Bacteroidales bacterium]